MIEAATIVAALNRHRFTFNDEAELQRQIADALSLEQLAFTREFVLTPRDRPDFFFKGGLVLEVKVEHNTPRIVRQMKRYADCDEVSALLLVSSRPHRVPPTLSNKPITNLALWRGAF